MSTDKTTRPVVEREQEALARKLDPIAWTAFAFSTSDGDLRRRMQVRRSMTLLTAAKEIGLSWPR